MFHYYQRTKIDKYISTGIMCININYKFKMISTISTKRTCMQIHKEVMCLFIVVSMQTTILYIYFN